MMKSQKGFSLIKSVLMVAGFLMVHGTTGPSTCYAGTNKGSLILKEMDRPSFLVKSAIAGRNKALGTLADIDGDGLKELVCAVKGNPGPAREGYGVDSYQTAGEDGGAEETVLNDQVDDDVTRLMAISIDRGSVMLEVPLGPGRPAMIAMGNLDEDDNKEFIVGTGSAAKSTAKKVAINVVSLAAGIAIGIYSPIMPIVIVYGPPDVDLRRLYGIDDDGSILWRRDLTAASEGVKRGSSQFRWLLKQGDEKEPLIIFSNSAGRQLECIDGGTGMTVWSNDIFESGSIHHRNCYTLYGDGETWPFLAQRNCLTSIDAVTGKARFTRELEHPKITVLPTGPLVTPKGRGALVLNEYQSVGDGYDGGDIKQLVCISLENGDVLWSLDITATGFYSDLAGAYDIDGDDRDEVIVIHRKRIDIYSNDGILESSKKKSATKGVPNNVWFADIDHDSKVEMIYCSGVYLRTWELVGGMGSIAAKVGSFTFDMNHAYIYPPEFDVDGDDVLDIAVQSQASRKLISGRDGGLLYQMKSGFDMGKGYYPPIVGDWDRNGRKEILWGPNWMEIVSGGFQEKPEGSGDLAAFPGSRARTE